MGGSYRSAQPQRRVPGLCQALHTALVSIGPSRLHLEGIPIQVAALGASGIAAPAASADGVVAELDRLL
jgi:hypothetical protein